MARQGAARLLLYKKDASPPSCAVMMLADLLGLKLEFKEPDLLNWEHKTPEFKKINPMGTIPVLEDDDFIVSESHAIMKYLLNKYGGALKEKLYPSDPRQQAIVDQCLFYDTGVFFVRLKVVAMPTLLGGLAGPTAVQLADIDESYSVVETYLYKNRYVAGDHLTVADLSLGSTVTAAQTIHKLDEDKFPRISGWLSRLQEEDCFKNINTPGMAILGDLLNSFWEKNKNKCYFFVLFQNL